MGEVRLIVFMVVLVLMSCVMVFGEIVEFNEVFDIKFLFSRLGV